MIIFAFLFGIISGIVTGLIPGLHINFVASLLFFFSLEIFFSFEFLLVYLISLSVMHTFVDFIPLIYCGLPNEDTFFGLNLGHKYLLKGEGHNAFSLTAMGSFLAILVLFFVVPIFFLILPKSYLFLHEIIPLILFFLIIFLFIDFKGNKIFLFFLFFLVGILGIFSLNSSIKEPLLPLLTGLFGIPNLILSFFSRVQVPKQRIGKIKIKIKIFFKLGFQSLLISPFCSLLPGVGSSQAAILVQKFFKEDNEDAFLVLLGSINTLVLTTSFFTLYLVDKKRSGISLAISQLGVLNQQNLILILGTIFFTGIFAFFISRKLSFFISKKIHLFDYSKISIFVLFFLIILVFFVSGWLGLVILISASSFGLITFFLGIPRYYLMSVLLVPTFLIYLPL